MTEAPERIWTPKNGQSIIPGGVQRWPSDVQYIRADHVCCLIAAAYVDAANLHQSLWRETSAYKTDQILKRTPNDARTALDALLKAEREKALETLEAQVRAADALAEWVEGIIEDGCPACGGDCSSANPPPGYCPQKEATNDLAAYRATKEGGV